MSEAAIATLIDNLGTSGPFLIEPTCASFEDLYTALRLELSTTTKQKWSL
jgi:hypothetical protein